MSLSVRMPNRAAVVVKYRYSCVTLAVSSAVPTTLHSTIMIGSPSLRMGVVHLLPPLAQIRYPAVAGLASSAASSARLDAIAARASSSRAPSRSRSASAARSRSPMPSATPITESVPLA